MSIDKEKLKRLSREYSKLTKSSKILFSDMFLTEENLECFVNYIDSYDDRVKNIFMRTIEDLVKETRITSKCTDSGFGVPVKPDVH